MYKYSPSVACIRSQTPVHLTFLYHILTTFGFLERSSVCAAFCIVDEEVNCIKKIDTATARPLHQPCASKSSSVSQSADASITATQSTPAQHEPNEGMACKKRQCSSATLAIDTLAAEAARAHTNISVELLIVSDWMRNRARTTWNFWTPLMTPSIDTSLRMFLANLVACIRSRRQQWNKLF